MEKLIQKNIIAVDISINESYGENYGFIRRNTLPHAENEESFVKKNIQFRTIKKSLRFQEIQSIFILTKI